MELRELKYFVAIAKNRSLTKAADQLFVSQPALSKTIKKLEGELEVPLFIIKPTGVFLTDYGAMLYERSVALLHEFDALKNFVSDVEQVEKGSLRVGATPIVGTLYMVNIIVDFCNLHPRVELKLSEGGTTTIRQQLLDDNLDLGLCLAGEKGDDLEETILFEDEMIVCLRADHPLAQHASLSFEQLRDEEFNFYAKGTMLYSQIIDRCNQAGFTPRINISSSKISMLIQMTLKGKGICILPRPHAVRYQEPDLRLIPLDAPFLWTVCLVKNKQAYQSYLSKLFENYVIDYFRQHYAKGASSRDDTPAGAFPSDTRFNDDNT